MAPLPEPRSRTVDAIYAMHAAKPREERDYLGLSALGEECERRLWYGFRWAHQPEEFTGRKIRLFDTGHREEARLIEELRAIGCEVFEVDTATGRQWSVETAERHSRGHVDGVVVGLPDAPKTAHVLEAKTHGSKSFRALVKDGVAKAKPVHYAQVQGYMHLLDITRALYLAVEKDTDELYAERIEYDAEFSLRLMAKAKRIVASSKPPAKLHDDPTSKAAFACKWCPSFGICHGGEWSRTNCRTCLYASPEANGIWNCTRFNKSLTSTEQRAGCAAHLFIPDLVPGEQIDVDEAAETVTYRMADGAVWVDGSAAP